MALLGQDPLATLWLLLCYGVLVVTGLIVIVLALSRLWHP